MVPDQPVDVEALGRRQPARAGRAVGRVHPGRQGREVEVVAQRRAGVLGAVDAALLQRGDERVDDVVEAVGDEVRREVEPVERALADEAGELLGQAGRRADVAAGRAGRAR